ncbi:MAG: PD40 domain-containing protein [Chloroflexi bacterium]|nr:PD40 domain-containing protein [Chloroflexota bacterium]
MKTLRCLTLAVMFAFMFGGCAPTTPQFDSRPPTATHTPLNTTLPGASPTLFSPATPPLAHAVPNTTLLYSRDCGLYALPSLAALDKPEMRAVYQGLANCNDFGAFLVGYAPILSPDHKQLFITGPYESWLANLETGALRKFFSAKTAPSWSPASDALAYVADETLYRLGVAQGAKPEPLFQHANLIPLFARWSPDGRWIAAASTTENNANGEPQITIWAIPATGGDARALGTIPVPATEWVPQDMQWAPDSQAIGTSFGWFLSLDGTKQLVTELATIPWWTPAQARKLIGNQVDPKWDFSHDGKRLAWLEPKDGSFQIVTIDASTRAQELIGTLPAPYALMVRWSADDRFLIIDAGGVIWKMAAVPGSAAEPVLKDALLVNVIPRPNAP